MLCGEFLEFCLLFSLLVTSKPLYEFYACIQGRCVLWELIHELQQHIPCVYFNSSTVISERFRPPSINPFSLYLYIIYKYAFCQDVFYKFVYNCQIPYTNFTIYMAQTIIKMMVCAKQKYYETVNYSVTSNRASCFNHNCLTDALQHR